LRAAGFVIAGYDLSHGDHTNDPRKIRSLGWTVRVEQRNGATAIYFTKFGEERSYFCQGEDPAAIYHAACEVAEMVGVELAG